MIAFTVKGHKGFFSISFLIFFFIFSSYFSFYWDLEVVFLEKLVNLECSQILVEMPFYFSAMLCQRHMHYLILVSILLN